MLKTIAICCLLLTSLAYSQQPTVEQLRIRVGSAVQDLNVAANEWDAGKKQFTNPKDPTRTAKYAAWRSDFAGRHQGLFGDVDELRNQMFSKLGKPIPPEGLSTTVPARPTIDSEHLHQWAYYLQNWLEQVSTQ